MSDSWPWTEGATWSDSRELVPGDNGGRGCVKNKPLVVEQPHTDVAIYPNQKKEKNEKRGEETKTTPVLLCGASTEAGGWRAFIDVSTDGGHEWRRTPDIHVSHLAHYPDVGIIQPSLWRSGGGGGGGDGGPSHTKTHPDPDAGTTTRVHAVFRSDAGKWEHEAHNLYSRAHTRTDAHTRAHAYRIHSTRDSRLND